MLALPAVDSGNVVAFATAGEAVELSLATLRERAKALKDATGLDLAPTIRRMEKSGTYWDKSADKTVRL